MATATRTFETKNSTVKISLTRDVHDKTSYADGYNINLGREVYEAYEVAVTSKATGKVVARATGKPGQHGFFNKRGDAYQVGQALFVKDQYDTAMSLIAELDAEIGKTAEQISIETAEAARIAAIIPAQGEPRHGVNGYCRKCHSYCYGDCGSN